MWVKVKSNLADHYFINTDTVSAMHLESSTVFLTAITGTGDGVLHLAPGEVERIAELLVHWKDIENASTDGIEIYVLPDNACCYASDGCVSPLDLMDCPLGAKACHPDTCDEYHEKG